uniref:Uncharacterized protein n=1 Tax=Arundo donax TaxID=35708 RepID=A0A0A9ERW9_ARUDO
MRIVKVNMMSLLAETQVSHHGVYCFGNGSKFGISVNIIVYYTV